MDFQLKNCCYEVVIKRLREYYNSKQDYNEDPNFRTEVLLPMLYERDTRRVQILI